MGLVMSCVVMASLVIGELYGLYGSRCDLTGFLRVFSRVQLVWYIIAKNKHFVNFLSVLNKQFFKDLL